MRDLVLADLVERRPHVGGNESGRSDAAHVELGLEVLEREGEVEDIHDDARQPAVLGEHVAGERRGGERGTAHHEAGARRRAHRGAGGDFGLSGGEPRRDLGIGGEQPLGLVVICGMNEWSQSPTAR